MDNNPKKNRLVTVVIIVLILLIIGALIFFLWYKPQIEKTVDNVETVEPPITEEAENLPAKPVMEQPANQSVPVKYEFNQLEEEERELTAEDLKQIAFSIAERFGSYSNQANYGNISDLKVYMTADMKDWADRFVAEQKEEEYSGEYYGITTKALTGEVLEFTNNRASILVSTRRQEINNDQTTVFDQDINIGFVKTNNDWKVNSAYWQ